MADEVPLISVVCVSWYSHLMLSRLFANLLNKAALPNQIHCTIIDNTNGRDTHIISIAEQHSNIFLKRIDSLGQKGSWAHAHGLNCGTKNVASKYTLVIDPDVYIFKADWDEFLINELENANAIAIGAPYPAWKLGKYHNFPSPPFIFYDTFALNRIGLDWTPFPFNPARKAYNFMARFIVRGALLATRPRLARRPTLMRILKCVEKLVGVCGPDTGWMIAARAAKAGQKSIVFNAAYANDAIVKLHKSVSLNTLTTDFEVFHYNNELMLSHKYSTNAYIWKTALGKRTDLWQSLCEQVDKESRKS